MYNRRDKETMVSNGTSESFPTSHRNLQRAIHRNQAPSEEAREEHEEEMQIKNKRHGGRGVGGRQHLQADIAHDNEHDCLSERGESARKHEGQRSYYYPEGSPLYHALLGCFCARDAASLGGAGR